MNRYGIANFILKHYPPARDWGAAVLVRWVCWHLCNNTLCTVKDDSENIKAVGVARMLMDPFHGAHNGVLTLDHDPEGKCAFIDLAVSVDPIATRILVLMLREQFGERDYIAYLKAGTGGVIRVRPWAKLRNSMLRKKELQNGRR